MNRGDKGTKWTLTESSVSLSNCSSSAGFKGIDDEGPATAAGRVRALWNSGGDTPDEIPETRGDLLY